MHCLYAELTCVFIEMNLLALDGALDPTVYCKCNQSKRGGYSNNTKRYYGITFTSSIALTNCMCTYSYMYREKHLTLHKLFLSYIAV